MQAKRSAAACPFLSALLRWAVLLAAIAVLPLASPALGQGDKKVDKKAGKTEKREKVIPKSEEFFLPAADGLQLAMTYYPGPTYPDAPDRQIIPVVLLHMWKQSRSDYKDLAPFLQRLGYAVLVPDLRGHGDSMHVKGARKEETINAEKMSPKEFGLMVSQDMAAIKQFLWDRNNKGELNIDKLCIVGAEMGASVALSFALLDAEEQDRNHVLDPEHEYKLGRFVKALVLLSPERTFHAMSVVPALKHPAVQRDISVLILVGKQDSKALEDAKSIDNLLLKYHPEPTGENKSDKRTLVFEKLDTSLQGADLLDPKFKVQSTIADFLQRRLVKSDDAKAWGWRERKQPYQ
jgi:dienelactone hydrolase